MKLEWHTSTQGGISRLCADEMVAAHVYQFRTGVYIVGMYTGSTWTLVGEFPSCEEAQQCAELLAPIYAGFTK